MYFHFPLVFALFAAFSDLIIAQWEEQSNQTIKLPIEPIPINHILRTSPKSNAIIIGIDRTSSRFRPEEGNEEGYANQLRFALMKNLSRAKETYITIYGLVDDGVWVLKHNFSVHGTLFDLAISDFGNVIAFSKMCEISEFACLHLLSLDDSIYVQDGPKILLGKSVDIFSQYLRLDSSGDTVQISSVYKNNFDLPWKIKVQILKRQHNHGSDYKPTFVSQNNFYPIRFTGTNFPRFFMLPILKLVPILAFNDLYQYFVVPKSMDMNHSSCGYTGPGLELEQFNALFCEQGKNQDNWNHFQRWKSLYLVSNILFLNVHMNDNGSQLLQINKLNGSNISLVTIYDYTSYTWTPRVGVQIPMGSVPKLSENGKVLAVHSFQKDVSITVHEYDQRNQNWIELGKPKLPLFQALYSQIGLSRDGKRLAFQGIVGEHIRKTNNFFFLFSYNHETKVWEQNQNLLNFIPIANIGFVSYSKTSMSSHENIFRVYPTNEDTFRLYTFNDQ